MEIIAHSVSSALSKSLNELLTWGRAENTRNGPVLAFTAPVMITYVHPTHRVLFSAKRNANPFFHLMESLWMLAGRNDLGFPMLFNSRFKEYSDDGKTIPGAYGHRWRKYFGRDQIELAIDELRRDPKSRRVVISMWSQNDLGGTGRDLPCNTHIYFDCRNGALNMTVCNRSNDLLWGACGANAVHFSILQEYVAFGVGFSVGEYRQFTNNLHLYTSVLPEDQIQLMALDVEGSDLYRMGVNPYPLVKFGLLEFDADLRKFFINPSTEADKYEEPFFRNVVRPVYKAWMNRKNPTGYEFAKEIDASDWRVACMNWLEWRAK